MREVQAAMFVNSDFSDLLRLFNANQVKHLVIGGYAGHSWRGLR